MNYILTSSSAVQVSKLKKIAVASLDFHFIPINSNVNSKEKINHSNDNKIDNIDENENLKHNDIDNSNGKESEEYHYEIAISCDVLYFNLNL